MTSATKAKEQHVATGRNAVRSPPPVAIPLSRSPRMKRALVALFAFLFVTVSIRFADAAPSWGGSVQVPSNAATSDYGVEREELAFLQLINEYRAQNGLWPLALSQTIGAAAEHHSTDMARNDYFN